MDLWTTNLETRPIFPEEDKPGQNWESCRSRGQRLFLQAPMCAWKKAEVAPPGQMSPASSTVHQSLCVLSVMYVFTALLVPFWERHLHPLWTLIFCAFCHFSLLIGSFYTSGTLIANPAQILSASTLRNFCQIESQEPKNIKSKQSRVWLFWS